MYKNILIPVVLDDSNNAQAAIAVAKVLADEGARFTFLHTVETIPVYVADYVPADVMQSARDKVAADLEALAKELPNSHAIIAEGKAGPRIERWAEENGADCIIVASHQPAFSDILLGSVAQHVVRHAHCAVHVIR